MHESVRVLILTVVIAAENSFVASEEAFSSYRMKYNLINVSTILLNKFLIKSASIRNTHVSQLMLESTCKL